MPKSSSERCKLYREIHKNDPEYKEQARKRQAKRTKKLQTEDRVAYNKACAARMRESRRKRKAAAAAALEQPEPVTPVRVITKEAFTTKQSAGKALKKAERALPEKTDQRLKILKTLCDKNGLELNVEREKQEREKPEVDKAIIDFYRREDISRCKPGRKDVVTITENGERKTTAKRFLYLTVNELHTIFNKEFEGTYSVGRSKFHSLRPADVFLVSSNDQEVCACPICVNMDFYCEAASLGICVKVVEQLLCENLTDICQAGQCNTCPLNQPNCMAKFIPEKETFLLKKWVKGILEVEHVMKRPFQF